MINETFIERHIKLGKKKAITSKVLYSYYKINGGKLKFSLFFRGLRRSIEEYRLKGNRIIGDEKGYYIAMTDEEWENYTATVLRRIKTEISVIASASNTTAGNIIKKLFPVDVNPSQINLDF